MAHLTSAPPHFLFAPISFVQWLLYELLWASIILLILAIIIASVVFIFWVLMFGRPTPKESLAFCRWALWMLWLTIVAIAALVWFGLSNFVITVWTLLCTLASFIWNIFTWCTRR